MRRCVRSWGCGRREVFCARMIATAVAGLFLISFAMAQQGTTVRVSVSSAGAQGNWDSYHPSISADGRYVAFESDASNLVAGDTNGYQDVFVRDRQFGTTERVSVSSSGAQGNSDSGLYDAISISADGRYVAFTSSAGNLVSGDTNYTHDVFVRDRQLGTTERVSVSSSGEQGNSASEFSSISADGRYVAFASYASILVSGDTNNTNDIFVRDRLMGTTERVSVTSSGTQGNSDSYLPSISADGRYVAFSSYASNLVSGDTNNYTDEFVRDRLAGTTERVSVSSSGAQGNRDSFYASISADGRYVAFESYASNLVAGDTNGKWDVFVRDRQLGTTERVSVSSSGAQGNSDSGDYGISISADGRYVAFGSYASNLVSGERNGYQDVFVRDRHAGTTERVSISSAGAQGNLESFDASISADGRYVAFASTASNLVAGDTNGYADVFVHQIGSGSGWGVTITGRLQPEGYIGIMPENVTFEFRNQGETIPFDIRTAIVAPDGSYTVTAYARQMDVSVNALSWLRRTVPTDASFGPVTGLDMTFGIGDANSNNAVDLYDLNAVFTAYGNLGGPADVEGDGLVDLPDLSIIFINFGLVGDP